MPPFQGNYRYQKQADHKTRVCSPVCFQWSHGLHPGGVENNPPGMAHKPAPLLSCAPVKNQGFFRGKD